MNVQQLEKKGYHAEFFVETQPQGGIYFTDSAIRTGEGWSTSLYVYKYQRNPYDLWMNHFMKEPDVVVTIDVSTHHSEKILEMLNMSMREQKDRYVQEKDESLKEEASDTYWDLKELSNSIRRQGEVVKLLHTRIFIHAPTLSELEKKVMKIRKGLESEEFRATSLLFEQKEEWQSLFLHAEQQLLLPNKRTGKPVPSEAFGGGFPCNFVHLDDPRGQYLGQSHTGGNIVFDMYHVDGEYRNFYNMLILGQTGFGKSTLMKKILMDNAAKGNFCRGFDKSGEFTDLIQVMGGKIFSLDGSDGMINPFEVQATVIDEGTGEILERASFMQHLSKMAIIYKTIKPSVSTDEVDEYESLLHKFYQYKGLVNGDEVMNRITSLSPKKYPIMSDFLTFIEREQQKKNTEYRLARLEKIRLTIEKLINTYGRIFNGHSTIPNITDEQIVFFNIDGLTGMDKPIIDAQLFNTLSLFWGSMMKHGKKQKELYEKKQVSFDEIIRFGIYIDECRAGRSRIN